MLDVRVYRAAFLPALIAVFVAAFSLADRPAPTTTRLSADAFDSGSAFGDAARPQRNSLNELARTFPNRAAGSRGRRPAGRPRRADVRAAGARHAPARVRGHAARRTEWDGADLETVVGVRPGLSSRRIVVVAVARRARAPRPRGAVGDRGAARARAHLPPARPAQDARARLHLGRHAPASRARARGRARRPPAARRVRSTPCSCSATWPASAIRKPWVVPWSNGGSPAPLALQRTVESALRAEVSPEPGRRARHRPVGPPRAAADDLRPGRGRRRRACPAVAIGTTGELAPRPDEPVTRARLGVVRPRRCCARSPRSTRPARSTPTARPRSPAFSAGPGRDRHDAQRAARLGGADARRHAAAARAAGGARRLVPRAPPAPAASAAGPAGSAPARCRRCSRWLWLRAARADRRARRSRPRPWSRTCTRSARPGSSRSPRPRSSPRVGWFGVRPLLVARLAPGGSPAAGGLAAATGLVVNVLAALVWLFNPYAAALLLPAAHLWLLAAAPGSRLRGPWAALPVGARRRAAAAGAAALRDARWTSTRSSLAWLLALVDRRRAHLGRRRAGRSRCGSAAWPGCWSSCACAAGSRRRPSRSARARAGPAGYAGPGSLGGTESALRR